VEEDERAGRVGRVVRPGELLAHLHAVGFVAVDGRRTGESRARFLAIDDRDGHRDGVAEGGLAHLGAELPFLAGLDLALVPERTGGRPVP
jgi:hypothetical protein